MLCECFATGGTGAFHKITEVIEKEYCVQKSLDSKFKLGQRGVFKKSIDHEQSGFRIKANALDWQSQSAVENLRAGLKRCV